MPDLFALSQQALRGLLLARGVDSRTAVVNGVPLHYYRADGTGRGPAVVMVHGLGGSANGFFRTFPGLARRFCRVYAPDLPGHGFSPLSPSGPLSVEGNYELVRAFCDEVVREPYYLVGNSLGGAMTIMLASHRPDRVKALALIAPAGAKVAQHRFEELARAMLVKTTAESRALTRRLFHRAPVPFLLFASELKKMYGTDAVRAVFEEMTHEDHLEPELLESLRMPVLLLWGESEKLLPYEGIDFFRAHLPPHARIEIVPKFGHVPQVEYPREVVRRLTRFADDVGL